MMDDDLARLERLLAWRRGEEELARRREAAALEAMEAAQDRLHLLETQLRACREGMGAWTAESGSLIDAHQCIGRLAQEAETRQHALEAARQRLAEVREALTEAGRRRLAIERIVTTRDLRLRDRARASAQADLDERGRLRLLQEAEGE